MSDKVQFPDIPWDEEVDEVAEAGPRTITDYGTLQCIGVKKVQLFASGERVTFPDFLLNGEPFSRSGMKEGWADGGKNALAHFIAFTTTNQQGEEYTRVVVYTSMPNIPVDAKKVDTYPVIALDKSQQKAKANGKTVWLADWSNLQFPAFRQGFNKKYQAKYSNGEPIHFKGDRWNTGTKPREDNQGRTNDKGEPKKYYDHYWFNIQTFETKEEMVNARGTTSNGTPVNTAHYPSHWVTSDVQAMLDYARTQLALSDSDLAKTVGLTIQGEPAKTVSGQSVDVAALIAEIRDVAF